MSLVDSSRTALTLDLAGPRTLTTESGGLALGPGVVKLCMDLYFAERDDAEGIDRLGVRWQCQDGDGQWWMAEASFPVWFLAQALFEDDPPALARYAAAAPASWRRALAEQPLLTGVRDLWENRTIYPVDFGEELRQIQHKYLDSTVDLGLLSSDGLRPRLVLAVHGLRDYEVNDVPKFLFTVPVLYLFEGGGGKDAVAPPDWIFHPAEEPPKTVERSIALERLSELEHRLLFASYQNDLMAIQECLEGGALLDARAEPAADGSPSKIADPEGFTALHFAAAADAERAVDFLLQHGADANTVAAGGWTPLHAALAWAEQDPRCLETLLRAGADREAETGQGVKPIKCAADRQLTATMKRLVSGPREKLKVSEMTVYKALNADSIEPLRELLEAGADPFAFFERAVSQATFYEPRALEYLIELGVDLNIEGPRKSTILSMACHMDEDGDQVRLLLGAGAKPTRDSLYTAVRTRYGSGALEALFEHGVIRIGGRRTAGLLWPMPAAAAGSTRSNCCWLTVRIPPGRIGQDAHRSRSPRRQGMPRL